MEKFDLKNLLYQILACSCV